jgi:hypothetical protein
MPRAPTRPAAGEERVFVDDVGRLWSAALTRDADRAVLFSCISESRLPLRAIAAEHAWAEEPDGRGADGGAGGEPPDAGRRRAPAGGAGAAPGAAAGAERAVRHVSLADVSDDTLRAWLAAAPHVTRLT